MAVTYDSSPDFVQAISLLAALEGACVPAGGDRALARLGMARAELTNYGQRLPSQFQATPVPSFADGLAELDDLLTQMLGGSDDLTQSLRLIAARQILREAIGSA